MVVWKGAGHHGAEAKGVSEAMGLGKGVIHHLLGHTMGFWLWELQFYLRNPVLLCLTVPIACTPTEEGDSGKEAGMRLGLLDLEFIAESCFVYYTHRKTFFS